MGSFRRRWRQDDNLDLGTVQTVKGILAWPGVYAACREFETELAGVERDAGVEISYSNRCVINAHERTRGSPPTRPAVVGKLRQFKRMSIRVAKLICYHRPAARRQQDRAAARDRREGEARQAVECGGSVGHCNREVLKPWVVCVLRAGVGRPKVVRANEVKQLLP